MEDGSRWVGVKRRMQELKIDDMIFQKTPQYRTAEEQDEWIKSIMKTATAAGRRTVLQAIRAVGTGKEGDIKSRNTIIAYLQKGNQEPLVGKEMERALREFAGELPGGKPKPQASRRRP